MIAKNHWIILAFTSPAVPLGGGSGNHPFHRQKSRADFARKVHDGSGKTGGGLRENTPCERIQRAFAIKDTTVVSKAKGIGSPLH